MTGNMVRRLLLAVTLLPGFSAHAVLIPSLGEQHPDIAEDELAEMISEDCLKCHGNPSNAITPADSGYLPDRHHLRVDTPIGTYSASPYPDRSSNGKHQCVTCHLVDWVPDPTMPSGRSYQLLQDTAPAGSRNCLRCHIPNPSQAGAAANQGNMVEATRLNADAYGTDLVFPVIDELSETSITADPESPLVILGTGFTNSVEDGATAGSTWVRLTDHDGGNTDIYPDYISPTHLEITIPEYIEPGNYRLTVSKHENISGTILNSQPATLSIKPYITIETVSCSLNTITVTGSGFSSHYPNVKNSGISIYAGMDGKECAVSKWVDNEIIATCDAGIGPQLKITTLYDSTASDIACSSGSNPKWWSIWSWWSSWSWSRR